MFIVMNRCLLLFLLVSIIVLSSCVEKIDSFVGDFQSSLVVDGLISDENIPYEIYLSRTTKNTNEAPETESEAKISVEDDLGNETNFIEMEPGKYISDPNLFIGMVNRSYRLKITTQNGKQYLSTWCELIAPAEIDSVYWETETYQSARLGKEVNGVAIYIDGKLDEENGQYCRWTFQEDWKFHSWLQENFRILKDNSEEYFQPTNYICWKSYTSHNVNIFSIQDLIRNKIQKKKIQSVHAADNDRLMMRYSILVKLLSISEPEYIFWKDLSYSEQGSFDLFGKQPYSISSNIYNATNPEEKVLGYFQVSGVTRKRIYINRSEALNNDVINYRPSQCLRDTVLRSSGEYAGLYEIYEQYYLKWKYGLADLLYPEMGPPYGIVFTSKPCSDCTVTGKNYPPDFWEEQ